MIEVMGSQADLALGCRVQSPIAVGSLYLSPPSSRDKVERVHILDKYLKALEDERRKIEAFKRELPHCMQLLDYAIDASKEHLVLSPPSSPGRPFSSLIGKKSNTLGLFGKEMVGDFLKTKLDSVKRTESGEEVQKARRSAGKAENDRPTWMAEAQLWSQPSFKSDQYKEKESTTEDSVRRKVDSAEQSAVTSSGLFFNSKQRRSGAFMPFVKEKPAPSLIVKSKTEVTDFMRSSGESRPTTNVLAPVESEVGSVEVSTRIRDVSMDISQGKDAVGRLNSGGNYSGGTGSTTSGGGNAQRKARRCWSPELHRRFVSALQQLGGSQIATPKQIRELMKVDGLTNDEVKSHLQKYRLHTRRPSPTPQGPQQTTPQLVVLGGIWVPPEYGNVGMYHDPAVSSVSQQEPTFSQPSHSQEFYSQLHPSVQIELHRSPSQSSPQGPLQSTSYRSSEPHQNSEGYREGSDDGKSESSSWKAENAENNSQGTSEKEEGDPKCSKDSDDEEEDDLDDANNEKDSGMRLQLEMACSSAHSIKIEPEAA